MQCTNCHQEVPDTANVCGYCGHPLKALISPPPVPTPTPISLPAGQPKPSSWNSTSSSKTISRWVLGGRSVVALMVLCVFVFGFFYRAKSTVSVPQVTSIPAITSVPTSTLEQIPLSPEATEVANWAITFEYRFPSGFWSVGTHEYTLESECPNIIENNETWTNSFVVSESADLFSGDVYLRLSGLREDVLSGNSIDSIHPLQTTIAAISSINMTRSQAELAIKDCKESVRWDGGTPQLLTPGLPFER